MDLQRIGALIRDIPDFPKKGILFKDIFPLFQDPIAVEMVITHIVNHINTTIDKKVDVIVGLDARGFLFGPLVAMRLGAAFAPVRKAGKLPGEVTQVAYVKEYGTDVFEMQQDSVKPGQNVVIVDDLIATGGSAAGAQQLVEKLGGNVLEFIFLIELEFLKGKDVLNAPIYSMIKA
ncbi:adenine phosphoribosyltransferase [Lunasporangiospora selenospora]|uniref:adenine phosphoribosyltransferase n=1 Tax=Lunasporangiospora selenospora TaxID=979761 RepID=A0A9P6FNR6_9FUNG|nr:adenine phosphoribosyltransferase [Lunasporangiospora selenospora]